ncbi:hypothetical protein AX774_g7437 [Zancudomyces culisetae]|uniref:Uncharacterized protein n=1 Tax=Zancudomyces culisetae TaxID=1213189 RepID=A0A1R1PDX5_ZANCU|nr:hypothetical protein AX774_g7437 [Zancudomyces culisetae]|eukprot:OMH79151.1 hypothetical protein AX774_g7437 [Zancudomyces culisetae]
MPERGDADYFALKTSAIFLNTVLSKSESLETLITQGSGYSFVTLTEKECQQLEVRLQKLVEMLLIQAAGVTVGLVDFVLLCYSKSDYSLTRLLGTNLMETVPAVISLLCNLVNFFASIAESIQSLSQQPDSLAEKDSSEQIGIKCLDLLSLFVDIYNFAIENPRNELLIDMAKNIHQSVGGLNTFFNISSGKNVGGDTDADGGVSRVRFATDINRINMLDVSIVDIFN